MLRNYLKVALRYLGKYKGYTAINVLGLAVGIACCILIAQFVKSEWSFDRFHSKENRLYRAWLEEDYQGEVFRNTVTPIPLGPVLGAGLLEAEAFCRVAEVAPPVKVGNNTYNDPVTMVDSTFFRMFDFPLKEGNSANLFANANSILLTQRAAKKYFGNEKAIGKNLELQLGDTKLLFTVGGLLQEPPLESSLQFDMLISFANASYIWSEQARTSAWSNVMVQTFVLLDKNAAPQATNSKIDAIMNPLVAKNYKPGEYRVRLQPMADLHFNSTLPEGMERPSDPKYAYILGTIGILVLLIACINFVTLSIGRSATRAMEVGVRKVLGAERQQLVRQFWGEALLLTLLAMLTGIGLSLILQKPFNQLANRELALSFNFFTVSFFILLVLVIAVLAGIYPAVILSGFKPVEVLKGKLTVGGNIGFFRKALIVGQFVASIVMIIGTFSVGRQLSYLRSKNLGFNREHVMVVSTNQPRNSGNLLAERLKNTLQKSPAVISATASLYSMAEYGWMQLGFTDNQKVFRSFLFNAVDADFVPAMDLQMVAGRSFQKGNAADSNYILVNESLVREYGWKEPIGQRLPGAYSQQVLGVVKDFHIESLHAPIRSAVLALKPDSVFSQSTDVSYDASPRPRVSVRFREGNVDEHIALLQRAWKEVAGDQDFDFVFLDEALNAAYQQEQRLGTIVQYASYLAIFIACMGLFGLATLIVVRRTKEIGIRKVLGADISRIVVFLTRDFVVLVMIASLLALPLAWWALQKWLQDFAYRIDFPWLAFLGAALLTLTIACVTVSFQAIKAALMNPVKSLRTE